MLVFSDYSDIDRYLDPSSLAETVRAIVHINGTYGPYRLADLPRDWEIESPIYVSPVGEVLEWNQLARTWIRKETAFDPWRSERAAVSLKRRSNRSYRGRNRPTSVAELVVLAWSSSGSRVYEVVRHINEDKRDSRVSNLGGGTRSENMVDLHTHRRNRTLPTGRIIQAPISAETICLVREQTQLKGRKFQAKLDELLRLGMKAAGYQA